MPTSPKRFEIFSCLSVRNANDLTPDTVMQTQYNLSIEMLSTEKGLTVRNPPNHGVCKPGTSST